MVEIVWEARAKSEISRGDVSAGVVEEAWEDKETSWSE